MAEKRKLSPEQIEANKAFGEKKQQEKFDKVQTHGRDANVVVATTHEARELLSLSVKAERSIAKIRKDLGRKGGVSIADFPVVVEAWDNSVLHLRKVVNAISDGNIERLKKLNKMLSEFESEPTQEATQTSELATGENADKEKDALQTTGSETSEAEVKDTKKTGKKSA